MSEESRKALLLSTLRAAVPLWWADLGLPDTLSTHLAGVGDIAQIIASQGDILQFGGKKGEAAKVFNELAKGIAILSAVPGGVPFYGVRWMNGKEVAE